MKKKLTVQEYVVVASMLFGLFFGAGNLIFPVHMGQMAGSQLVPATLGFLITGVGLPLLSVAALGISKSEGLRLWLLVFSAVFFAAALLFSLFPGKILTWVGKILNPFFLLFLGILIIVALVKPSAAISAVAPEGAYASQAFSTGFLEGYNTMDVLAGLAFGIIVVQVIRELGVFSSLLMALIYLAVTVVGAQSRGLFATSENGGIALAQIARHYLGSAGLVILAATVTLACLKTSVGLITSCAETFCGMFPKGPGYRAWAVLFTLISFALSNFGLSTIISYSVPVLMFLYPLAIALVLLALFGRFYRHDRAVYISVIVCTLLAALYDLICALPEGLYDALHADAVQAFGLRVLPFAGAGLGWICPLALGFVIGLAVHLMQKFRTK